MARNWKNIGETVNDVHCRWNDLLLEDEFGITEEDWNDVIQQTVEYVRSWGNPPVTDRISRMVDLLLPPLQTLWRGKDSEHPFRWLPCPSLPGATVADHSLIASAIAYCLGYDDDDLCPDSETDRETLDCLRLSALTATWEADGFGDIYDTVWTGLSPITPKADGSRLERIVYLAKTAASERIAIDATEQFSTHPLKNQQRQIGLVLGGATKIKGYFLESSRLPEVRGASALLDRINLEDIPALFGREIPHDPQRSESIHKNFRQRSGQALSAPECVIYAAGGNTLAFTPASVVHEIADEIERTYTHQTLVANSVAVGETFDLLELQYGLTPDQFWVTEFREACDNSKGLQFMEDYYGGTENEDFLKRKCFGELTTKLARAQFHRREGNPTPDRKTGRELPVHVEIGAYQLRCESCERRPAIIPSPRVLCEACARKHVMGRVTKGERDSPDDQRGINYYLDRLSGWKPATLDKQSGWCLKDWSSLFKEYLQVTGKETHYLTSNQTLDEVRAPQDLKTIANASDPSGFITFIYADGNNMGGYLEDVGTPAQYRQFSERVFVALQKAAFDALAEHLSPTDKHLHPFEIVSIGGDDLLLIVPGGKAFEVVHAIGENFDREFDSQSKFNETTGGRLRKAQRYIPNEWSDQQTMQPAISLSLGFVIANEHTPIGFLEHIADSLLRSAKSRAKILKKSEVGYLGGTVDFLVLKSFSMVTSELSDFRKRFYKTDKKNVLTMRPFTLHEFYGFIQTVRGFKESDFPRSQLYQLRKSLLLGRQTSTLDYLYFRSRLGGAKAETLQKALEWSWQGVSDQVDGLGPWYAMLRTSKTDRKRYETLILDLIEAYEFIAGDNNSIEGSGNDKFID